MTTKLEVKCKACKKPFVREVKTYQPEDFSPDGTKSIMSQYWCPHCKEPQAARYEFYRNKQGEVCARVKKYINAEEIFNKRQARQHFTSIKPKFDN